MTSISLKRHRASRTPSGRSSVAWPLAAAALLLASAAVQFWASLQRWVVVSDAWTRTDSTVQDHRYDYAFPSDPWENLGATAQLHGLGMLLLAAAVIAMGRTAERRRGGLAAITLWGVAATFAVTGLHGVLSGVLGYPSPLQYLPIQMLLSAVAFIALVVLAVRWLPSSWPTSIAAIALLAQTLPGLIFVSFVVAPAVAGFQSYDTTPWTETIIAVVTAAGAPAMLVATFVRAVRRED